MYSPNHSPPTRRTARRIGPCPPHYADSLSGKTAFFNQVTGSNQKVAIDVLNGGIEGIPIPDLVVCVVDASSLERHLHLALRVIDSGLPMILALNMVDLAEQSGLRLDPAKIAEELGVPVVPMQANAAKGIIDLKQSLRLPFPPAFVFMTGFAWCASLVVFQVGSLCGLG